MADGIYSPNNVTLVAPSTTRGTVSGQILNMMLAPIKAATVNLNVGGPSADLTTAFTTTTDDQGNFNFTLVPGGATGTITVSATGFATARTTFFVPDAAGNVPINNANANIGPLILTSTTGTFKALVLDPSGRPAAGAKALLEVFPAATILGSGSSGTYGFGIDVTVVAATADAAGLLTFAGVPPAEELSRLTSPSAGTYTVTVAAPLDSTGAPTSNGQSIAYTAASVLANAATPVIQLTALTNNNSNALAVIGTNVPSLMGTTNPIKNMLKPADAIYVVFNESVAPASVRVILSDEYGKQNLAFTKTLSASGNVLTIQPTAALTNGAEYNVTIRALSTLNQSSLFLTGYLFGGDPAAPLGPVTITKIEWIDAPVKEGILNPGEQINVYFNQPVGQIGFNQTVQAYFNTNIDGSTGTMSVGDARGETGFAGAGWDTNPREPLGGFPQDGYAMLLVTSGYSTRWQISFAGDFCLGTPCNSVNSGTEITLAFSRLINQVGNVQTLWGQAITDDLKSNLVQGN